MRPFALACSLGLALLSGPAPGDTPKLTRSLYDSVLYMDATGVKDLLAKGADPNHVEGDRSLLGWAAQNGNVPIVEALLAAGADPNFIDGVGHTPLMRAIETHHTAVANALLAAKPDLSIRVGNGRTLAMLAVETGKVELVRPLLDAGADFNATDPDGNSPALVAAQGYGEEMYDIIALLGSHKVDMDRSNAAYTALYYAVEQGNARLVAGLLKAGANPNAAAEGGRLPLFAALPQPEILRLLLDAKADPNAANVRGEPLLFAAIDSGSVEAVDTLIDAGADVNRKDPGGRTPLAYANSMFLQEMAEALKRHGASEDGGTATTATTDSIAPRTGAPPRNEYDALPKIRMVQAMQGTGSEVVYYSDAPVKEIVAFYRREMPAAGWKTGKVRSDDKNSAELYFSRGGERLSVSLGLETGRKPARVLVDIVPHGALRVPDLPRYPGSTPLFEQEAIAIYLTTDSMGRVADETLKLLKGAGWKGGLTAKTAEMRHLTLSRDGNELTVQVSVAPAQNNQTTIQYSLARQ